MGEREGRKSLCVFRTKRKTLMYFVYILRCSDETYYTGITTDIKRRLREHNTTALGAKYTLPRRPVSLVYLEKYTDRSSASKEEARIKKLSKSKKDALIFETHTSSQ
jgi:putative endonuclease